MTKCDKCLGCNLLEDKEFKGKQRCINFANAGENE